jgi:hypothetical protein
MCSTPELIALMIETKRVATAYNKVISLWYTTLVYHTLMAVKNTGASLRCKQVNYVELSSHCIVMNQPGLTLTMLNALSRS